MQIRSSWRNVGSKRYTIRWSCIWRSKLRGKRSSKHFFNDSLRSSRLSMHSKPNWNLTPSSLSPPRSSTTKNLSCRWIMPLNKWRSYIRKSSTCLRRFRCTQRHRCSFTWSWLCIQSRFVQLLSWRRNEMIIWMLCMNDLEYIKHDFSECESENWIWVSI